ncbi:MAG TPA: peptide transporter [Candidatus Sumerlaeota bacterium]|nr:MAG: hypothetical protein BWZ08_00171 [candidate division BRC1 bacterium ADurb.BinA292]HOE95391.1 peptide transporter [Candidatus Sumerlaeota bacterium]HOR27062.1 peptide transporter [Candidatus Sumerlaeota bacterium]HPK01603.1 peptide transporter [Candidatus Sumerlaeota bacterium]
MARDTHDREVELYRSLLETPAHFREGFSATTVVGIFFCGLVMMPGAIYLGLMTGGNLGPAAAWVTVILFMEIARRALKPLASQQLVVLLHAANVMMAAHILFPGGPMGQLVYRAYLVLSDAARDAGMALSFPEWFVPPPGSDALAERTLWHRDWLVPILIIAFMMVIGLIKRYTLGYFFFRLTSDIERLPFPLAPIAAQGAMALAEAEGEAPTADDPDPRGKQTRGKTSRWRIFSLGAIFGLGFGLLQIGIPGVSSLFLAKPFFLIPQPFVDTTVLTQGILPATPTGLTFDLGIVFLGFVLPFWVVIGSFLAIATTILINPILYHAGVLTRWQPGMDTVNTTFANHIDFWMSLTIGTALGIAVVCFYATLRDVVVRVREARRQRAAGAAPRNLFQDHPAGRGDYPLWIALVLYIGAASAVVALCWFLLPKTFSIFFFLIFFTFAYTPLISYVNARLLGISGQNVEIPFVKETAFILSGARGIDIWLAPVPVENYGYMAQAFRVNELTGVRFPSLLKTELVAIPILLVLSLVYWSFIWHSDPIPSDLFPAAQVNWELQAKNQVLLYSSTFVGPGETGGSNVADSEFMQAIHPWVIGSGFVGCIALYAGLSLLGLPIMLIYGVIRGLGQLPHFMILEVVGALLGRFYFQKRFGQVNFLRLAPALLAGYYTGVGLISMMTMALMLIKSAISSAPF